ncbi:hypothetical protein LTR94_029370, partial [Friedmanniomyces endolithicus]
RRRPQERRRLDRLGRHRRCRRLCAPEHGAGPRGAGQRQLDLRPRPGRAHAARGAVQRPVQPEAGRKPRLHGRAHGLRQGWQEDRAQVHTRPDAQPCQAVLRTGAIRHRRPAGRRHWADHGGDPLSALERLSHHAEGPRAPQPPGHRKPRAPHHHVARRRHRRHRAAQVAGGPPPDRRDDDPGQRLRRRDAGEDAHAADLSRPRHAQPGKDLQPGRLPAHHRQAVEQGRGAEHQTLQQAAGGNPRHPARRGRQRSRPAHPDA